MRDITILLILLLLISCSKNTTTPTDHKSTPIPPAAAVTPAQEAQTNAEPLTQEGIVTQAFTVAGPNTAYLEIDTQGKKIWVAVANMGLKAGDPVKFSTKDAMLMENFNSQFLKRKFDKVWFVQQIEVIGQTPAPVNAPKQ